MIFVLMVKVEVVVGSVDLFVSAAMADKIRLPGFESRCRENVDSSDIIRRDRKPVKRTKNERDAAESGYPKLFAVVNIQFKIV